jgi:MFS family permease
MGRSIVGPENESPGMAILGRCAETQPLPLRTTLGLVTLTWVFGSVWQTAITGAPLTRFANELNASPWQFGLLTAMPFIASLLSLPASLLIERTGARKSIFLLGVYFQRALWFAIALLPVWIVSRYGVADAPRAVWWFLALTFLMYAGQALGGPAWVSWMADVVPGRVRGKFFSRRRQWGILPAIPAAVIVGWLLDRNTAGGMGTLHWCALIFMWAAAFGLADVALFHAVPDVPAAPRRGAGLLRAMARPLRDRQFLVFGSFTGMMTFSLCFMTQFVALYVVRQLRVTSTQAQLMLVVGPMLAQLLVLGAWGAAADRMGKKPVLIIAGLGLVPVGLGWVLVGPSQLWLAYLLLALGAALWTGVEVANLNLVMEMGGNAKRRDAVSTSSQPAEDGAPAGGTAYVATNTVIINIAGCLGGLAAGLIAQALKDWTWHPFASSKVFTSFDVLFVISGLLRLASVAMFLPLLAEPGARPAAETLRFMGANLLATALAVIAWPARLLSSRSPDEDRSTNELVPDPNVCAAEA